MINTNILLVSDLSSELKDIQHILAADFGALLKAHSVEEGLSLFKSHHPSVLLLAFQDIEKAEVFLFSLLRLTQNKGSRLYQTILLCKGTETKKAYELCKNSTFDDFVADRPLFEPYRLCFSVSQAVKRHHQEQVSFYLTDNIEKIATGLALFDNFISDQVKSADVQQKSMINTFQHFTKNLATDLTSLEENLVNHIINKNYQDLDQDIVNKQFDHFRKESIEEASKPVILEINKSDEALKSVCNEHKKQTKKNIDGHGEQSNIDIMIIDDDDLYRDIVLTMLVEADKSVKGFPDAQAALAELHHYNPTIILLDYKMPVLNGIETLKILKSNPKTKDIPVIMLTGISERKVVAQCIGAGANDFILKPSNRDAILAKVDEVLNLA